MERSGRFRVYRVVESVPHCNLQAVDDARLYTVYQSGYGDRQPTVDDLRTGDLVEATLSGNPDADDEPWRFESVRVADRIEMGFAVDIETPAVATDLWSSDDPGPDCAVLTEDGDPVGACCVQPRDPLPDGAFVQSVLTGLLPLEQQFRSIPGVGEPATEALFLDPDPPGATSYSRPYGVVLLFAASASTQPDRFRAAYDCPRDTDTRPEFDPYGL